MTDLNALADWLEKSPTATLGFVKDGLTKVVTPKYLLKSDVDWIIAQARTAATSQASVKAMRELLPPLLKTSSVMKSANEKRTLMSIWDNDVKAVSDVAAAIDSIDLSAEKDQ